VISPLSAPAKLESFHEVSNFDCGAEELTTWLKRYALMNQLAGNARVFVTCRGDNVVGYYALATAGVEKARAPASLTKGGMPTQVPCLLLARLAVDVTERAAGVGRSLFADAVKRVIAVSHDVGVRALLIHCRDEEAKSYYLGLGELQASPTDPLHLFLHIKRAKQLILDS